MKDGQVPGDEREGELLVADEVDIGNLEEGVVVSTNKFGVLDGLRADLVDVLWLRWGEWHVLSPFTVSESCNVS